VKRTTVTAGHAVDDDPLVVDEPLTTKEGRGRRSTGRQAAS